MFPVDCLLGRVYDLVGQGFSLALKTQT